MSKIAIIVQRYGIEVNGGAEYHARILAEQLQKKYDVAVLTTKSVDYVSWDNYYKNDIEIINDVIVKRFKTDYGRQHEKLRKFRRKILKNKRYERLLNKHSLVNYLDKRFHLISASSKQSENWLNAQGPYCPDMITYLQNNKEEYNAFIFFTYLYYPTAVGMKEVKEKSIFIPTAHNEPELFAITYESVFESARFIMYNTLSEKKLVESTFKNLTPYSDVAGIGIDPVIGEKIERMKAKMDGDYFLYIGRIDPVKNCHTLYKQFLDYKEKNSSDLKLIFVGKNHTELQPTSDILFTGFVDEDYKINLLSNAKALIIPSKFESLSMVALEAMSRGKIVISNGDCEVLKDHIINSNSGFFYHSDHDLFRTLDAVTNMSTDDLNVHAENAKTYIQQNYTWNKIVDKFDRAIKIINEPTRI
ncbi:glycosyltransferase family 4 protein [Zunongwangia sp.]|uniref:glycosyltransferase family 4 protein n=1 Tax=Zunongwangia sp. TaxID=1965325 RepID=UPI003AA89E9F